MRDDVANLEKNIEGRVKEGLEEMLNSRNYEIGKYYVSELVYCLRKVALRRIVKDVKEKKNKDMVCGTAFHSSFLPFIFREYEREVEVKEKCEDFEISGRADCVDEGYIIEAKFVNSINEHKISRILPSYILQANFYAVMLKKEIFVLLFIDPVNVECYAVSGRCNSRLVEALKKDAKKINDILKSEREIKNIIDKVSGPRFEFECNKCEYRDVCL